MGPEFQKLALARVTVELMTSYQQWLSPKLWMKAPRDSEWSNDGGSTNREDVSQQGERTHSREGIAKTSQPKGLL